MLFVDPPEFMHLVARHMSVFGGLPYDASARVRGSVTRRSRAISAQLSMRDLPMSPLFVRRPSRNGRSVGNENL